MNWCDLSPGIKYLRNETCCRQNRFINYEKSSKSKTWYFGPQIAESTSRCYLLRCIECQRGLAMRKVSVSPSVCPSVKRVHYDKTEERSVQIFYTICGGDPFYLKFGSTGLRWSEIADVEPILARSASAVTPSKKVQLTLIGSPLRAFE